MQIKFKNLSEKKHHHLLKEFEACAFPLMDKLYRTALVMTKDQLDAEDLVQDTYVKAWQYFNTFKAGTNFEGWIFRILTNNYINQYRKEKRSPLRQNFETVYALVPNEEANKAHYANEPEDVKNYHEIFDDSISDALDKLSEIYRIVVLLADVAELRYKEIAKLLNCPIGTVMSRLNRARKILANTLQSYAEADGYLAQSN